MLLYLSIFEEINFVICIYTWLSVLFYLSVFFIPNILSIFQNMDRSWMLKNCMTDEYQNKVVG